MKQALLFINCTNCTFETIDKNYNGNLYLWYNHKQTVSKIKKIS